MNLSVRDTAGLLKVSEKTIYRWIKQQTIPAYRVQDQYRFNRAEILEWATSRHLNVSSEIFNEPEAEGQPVPSLLMRWKPEESSIGFPARTRRARCVRSWSCSGCQTRWTAGSSCGCFSPGKP